MTIRSTSLAARPAKSKKRVQYELILRYVHTQGRAGATLHEIEVATGLPGNSVRPRRQELEHKGLICDSGKRRPTPSGKSAIVWVTRTYK